MRTVCVCVCLCAFLPSVVQLHANWCSGNSLVIFSKNQCFVTQDTKREGKIPKQRDTRREKHGTRSVLTAYSVHCTDKNSRNVETFEFHHGKSFLEGTQSENVFCQRHENGRAKQTSKQSNMRFDIISEFFRTNVNLNKLHVRIKSSTGTVMHLPVESSSEK